MLRTRTILYIYAPVFLIVLWGVTGGLARNDLAVGLGASAVLFGAWVLGGYCFSTHERLEREERDERCRRVIAGRRRILFPDDAVEPYPYAHN